MIGVGRSSAACTCSADSCRTGWAMIAAERRTLPPRRDSEGADERRLGDDALLHETGDDVDDAGERFAVVVEAHDRAGRQVSFPSGEVETNVLLVVVAVDEQQPNLRASPRTASIL